MMDRERLAEALHKIEHRYQTEELPLTDDRLDSPKSRTLTTEEIKAAMHGHDRPMEPAYANENPETWAEIAEWEGQRANTLAATVRELYWALKAIRAYAEYPVSQDDGYAIVCHAGYALDRYRAALEDDE